jgi:low affinity Fe/Cu permease
MINTGTTIVTFLMVFLIQNTQNRDGAALQAKLDELIRVTRNARNELVAVERQPEEMLDRIREDILRKAEGEIECTTLRSTVPSSGFPSFP